MGGWALTDKGEKVVTLAQVKESYDQVNAEERERARRKRLEKKANAELASDEPEGFEPDADDDWKESEPAEAAACLLHRAKLTTVTLRCPTKAAHTVTSLLTGPRAPRHGSAIVATRIAEKSVKKPTTHFFAALSIYQLRPASPLGPSGTPPWHNPGTVGTSSSACPS